MLGLLYVGGFKMTDDENQLNDAIFLPNYQICYLKNKLNSTLHTLNLTAVNISKVFIVVCNGSDLDRADLFQGGEGVVLT